MVKAIIDISDHSNHVLKIVKAKYGLNDKSEAIDFITTRYEEEIMEPELRPEFVEKVKKIKKGKFMQVKDFSKRYELD
jgi:hypothetical protein